MNLWKTGRYIFIVCMVLVVYGCSSGDDSGTPASTTSAITDANPDGIYSGSFTENGVTYNMAGIVYNNKFVGASVDAGVLYTGNIGISGNTMTGQVDILAIGGGYDHTTTINATVVEGSSITGTATDAISTASFTLNIDSIWNRTPDVNLAGTYSFSDGLYTLTVSVNNDGSFTGSDTDGCALSGSQNNFDSSHNLYALVVTVSNCGIVNGTYTGYALNDDLSVQNDLLIWVLDDPDFVAVFSFLRQ
jgi:hypothetical protein